MGFMVYLLVPQLAKPSPKRTVPLSAVGGGSGNPQFQLSPSSRPAPGFQVRADFRCSFPHSSHPPVARFATGFENLRVNTGTVVTKSQTQFRGIVCNFNFNAFCTRMLQRIYLRLVADPIC